MHPKPNLRWIVACLCLLSVCAVAWAAFGRRPHPQAMQAATWSAPQIPDSPAGRQLSAYLEAFNSGSTERLAIFARENFTEVGPGGATGDERVRPQLSLYNSSRGLNPFKVHQVSEGEIELIAQFRLTQEWRQMILYFEQQPPYKISGIRIAPIEAPDIPSHTTGLSLAIGLDAYLTRLSEADQFSGVVLIAKDGKPEYIKALGLANKEEEIRISLDTPFHYASVGKMFTAVAIGQLIEGGKLSLDDKVEKYLPDYPANAISVNDLLSHRSGIPDFFELLDKRMNSTRDKQAQPNNDGPFDLMSVFAHEPLHFQPGERFEYSNSNFILLGAIIERVGGQSYENYLNDHIFGPAEMKLTTLDPADLGSLVPARGYTELSVDGTITPGQRRPNQSFGIGSGGAAGGGVTTAGDLVRFSQSLCKKRLISAKTLATLLESQVDGPRPGEHYARGFILRDTKKGTCFGHSGGFPGVDAQFDIYRDGWTVVVLANYEGVAEPVARHIESLLSDKTL